MVKAAGDAGREFAFGCDDGESVLVLERDAPWEKAGDAAGFKTGVPRGIPSQVLKVNHESGVEGSGDRNWLQPEIRRTNLTVRIPKSWVPGFHFEFVCLLARERQGLAHSTT